MKAAAMALALAVSLPAQATIWPRALSKRDASIMTVAFDPLAATNLCLRPGWHVTVEFDRRERITDHTMGLSTRWELSLDGWRFTLKQIKPDPATDLTVYTVHPTAGERTYYFDLLACRRRMRAVKFTYTAEQQVAAVTAAASVAAKPAPEPAWNTRYDGQALPGNWDLEPLEVRDDGRVTEFVFAREQRQPIVYRVHDDGSESLVQQPTIEGRKVIPEVSARWRIDLGGRSFCVIRLDPIPRTAP